MLKYAPAAGILFVLASYTFGQNQPKSAANPPVVAISKTECDNLLSQAKIDAFTVGVNLGNNVLDTTDAGKIKLQIRTEDIKGADSFQYAAADVIHTQFGERIEIVPKSDLVLYISGTDPVLMSSYSDAQELTVEVIYFTIDTFVKSGKPHRVSGSFKLSSSGGIVIGYSLDKKAQTVREDVYSAISKFLGEIEN